MSNRTTTAENGNPMNRTMITHCKRAVVGTLAGAALLTGILTTTAPAAAAPGSHQRPPDAVQVFGPYPHHQACTANLNRVKGAYAIPMVRRAHRWHEGGTFSRCHRARGGWHFTLTAPPRRVDVGPLHRQRPPDFLAR